MDIMDKDLAGRIGRIKIKGKTIETPYLFPVIDPTRQEVPISSIKSMGFNGVITNAYLAYKRGWNRDIHELIGDGELVVMTDSGAYQLMQYNNIEVSNEEIIKIQKGLNSDIAVILDVPTGDSLDQNYAKWTAEETLRRASEAQKIIDRDNRMWVLPIQGGIHLSILEESSKKSSQLEYDIYAIGSPTKFMERYRYDVVLDMIRIVRENIRADVPLHLFGAGHPMIIPFAVAMGVDLFDSASYILFARDGRYMIEGGTLRLEDIEYFPCSCPICSRYTPKELKNMNKDERTRLLAEHNLYMIKKILNEVKQAINEGRLWELLQSYSRKHPSLYSAFNNIKNKHVEWMEKYTPRVKGEQKAIYLFDNDSMFNPKILRARKYIMQNYMPPSEFKEVVFLYATYKNQRKFEEGKHYIYYAPGIGLIPQELSGTYPWGQNVIPSKISYETMQSIANDVVKYIEKFSDKYLKVSIGICDEMSIMQEKISSLLDEETKEKVYFFKDSCENEQ
ncbi:tRNA guanosine(15) transglycosylase TgtA [Fervidicoccus fontis]|uniref:tRNA-guanine(15) transglycosylase n=2 Tax=Fervidicoccus fontis TaxID=683846 RepID=I0A229_FERFK|nr:tRNA guanosine(15) transglycosylase TgtA [Fervidicoccus fontis]AFH43036.1 Queuine/archaeosine tRNA-ribosyltransferase [Fervidicoccus fontis Kam940]MBE9391410.1 tRNA guanosine(15) transglycosylase TgtA [Fervidicoccus fontis]